MILPALIPRSRQMPMGQKPVPPVNIPIPTKIKPKMGGAPTPKWDPVGFDPQPNPILRGSYPDSANFHLTRSIIFPVLQAEMENLKAEHQARDPLVLFGLHGLVGAHVRFFFLFFLLFFAAAIWVCLLFGGFLSFWRLPCGCASFRGWF